MMFMNQVGDILKVINNKNRGCKSPLLKKTK